MMLLINDVPLNCINQAAVEYHVPAPLIISILKTENGRVGQANLNTNGSFDLGPMQINSRWLPVLKNYGYFAPDVQFDPCINVKVGTWILANALTSEKNLWQGIGDYHSHTATFNRSYQIKVQGIYSHLMQALNH